MPATRMCPVRGGVFARLAPRGRSFEFFFGFPRVAPWAILVASLREAGWMRAAGLGALPPIRKGREWMGHTEGASVRIPFGFPRVSAWAIFIASVREAGWAAGVFGAREGVAGAEQAAEKGLG
jgi:hypothetical protein